MGRWAIVEINGVTFRVRGRQKDGEPRVVIEPLTGDMSSQVLRSLTELANGEHEELKLQYIPYRALAVAEVLATKLQGEVIEYSKPPEGGTIEPGVVF